MLMQIPVIFMGAMSAKKVVVERHNRKNLKFRTDYFSISGDSMQKTNKQKVVVLTKTAYGGL